MAHKRLVLAALMAGTMSTYPPQIVIGVLLVEISESKAFLLGKTIETITFKTHDFPFPSSTLLHEIDMMIYNRYVREGEVFEREVYGHKYTIEAVDVSPNGARYQRDISKIILL